MALLLLGNCDRAYGQVEITVPKDSAVSLLNRQVVTVHSVPGAIVELAVNGKVMAKDTVRIDGILDFINVEVRAGDVDFEARLLSATGAEIGVARRRMHILGPPVSLEFDLVQRKLPADGVSSAAGAVRVFDLWNYLIPEELTITLEVDSGTIRADDIDRETRGTQVRIHNGVATFEYVAGNSSGTAIIRASVGIVQRSIALNLNTPLEKFTLVGLATGTGQAARAAGDLSDLNSSRAYPDGLVTDGRLAVYARGTVFNDYRLVASFDNDRRNASRFYRDLDPDFLYSIYGDNSMLTYDAQTTRQLYARLERNKTYAMIGDFNTELTKQEFTLYNRSLYGLKAGHQENDWRFTGFGSLTDRTVVQVEIRGTGLSGLYDLGYLNVTPGSEKVRVETRDRFHSEVLLRQTDQYRFGDYEIDYSQGTMFFKQPVPAVDPAGNPVYIVVSFEAYDGRKKSVLAGGRAEHDFADYLTVGLNGVVEEQEPSNYALVGGDLRFNLSDHYSVDAEVGKSNHFTGGGLAYKVESSVAPIREISLKGYYRRVEKDFLNITQSGSGRELGTRKYGAGGAFQLSDDTRVSADHYRSTQEAQSGDVYIKSLSGAVEQVLAPDLTGSLRMEELRYEGRGKDTSRQLSTNSLLASARLNYALGQRLTLGVQHDRNLGVNNDITRPDGTMLSADYKIAEPLSLQAQHRFYDDGSSLSSVGITSVAAEGTTLYGKYEIGNAIGQHRNLLSIGLKNRLKLPWDLTANFALERAKSLETRLGETPTEDHSAYSGSLEYLPERPLKSSLKVEYGENNLGRKWNYFMGVDFRLHPDVSAILKANVARDNATQTSAYENRHHVILGAAYRPIERNWMNLIAKFEAKRDDNHYLAPYIDAEASIFSAHAFIEPLRRVELGVKFAYKHGVERTVGFDFLSHTYFYLIDARYDVTQQIDVGVEYRLMRQKEAGDWLIGYHAEAGYTLVNNLRVAAGYNFKGYKERDLVDYSLWSQGPFVRMSFKFDEELFGIK